MRRKRRTREHVIADLGVNFVERQALLCGHSVLRVVPDYGYDLILFTHDASGQVENGFVFVQVKATDHLQLLRQRGELRCRVSKRDLLLWRAERMPVILVLYDAVEEVGYWLHVQDYLASGRIVAATNWVTFYIKSSDRLDRSAMEEIATIKNAIA